MAQVWRVRLPTGEVVRPGEWSSTPLWSTVEIASGAIPTLKAFSYGVGGDVPGSLGPRRSNFVDTNLEGSGNVLAENEELLLYSLHVDLFKVFDSTVIFGAGNVGPFVDLQDVLRVQRDCVVVMKIANTKEYAREKIGFFPQGMGVNPYLYNWSDNTFLINATNWTDVAYGSNGGVSVWDNREFATPHHVAPGEAFEVGLTFPLGQVGGLLPGGNASVRILARVFAAGYRKRPVA